MSKLNRSPASFGRRMIILSLVVAAYSLVPLTAEAQVRGSLANFDVWNFTGSTANDFEVYMGGVKPADINSTYKGDYPNSTSTDLGTGTVVRWTGSSTADTGKAHFGVGLSGNVQPIPVSYTWTFDGNVIGTLPRTWQGWDFDGRRRDIFRNFDLEPVWIQRRWATFDGTLVLDDLLRDSPLWNSAILIDTAPLQVMGNSEVTFDFDPSGVDTWYFLGYDVMEASGRTIMTSLNAAQAVPEPMTLLALGAGVAMVARRRRQR